MSKYFFLCPHSTRGQAWVVWNPTFFWWVSRQTGSVTVLKRHTITLEYFSEYFSLLHPSSNSTVQFTGHGWLRSCGFVSKFTSALCVSAMHLTYSMELGCSGWGRDWMFLNHLNYMVNNFSIGLVENSNGMSFFIYGSSVVQMFSGESM